LIDIIETLEAQGLDREKSQLYDYIDVDALEQLCTRRMGMWKYSLR